MMRCVSLTLLHPSIISKLLERNVLKYILKYQTSAKFNSRVINMVQLAHTSTDFVAFKATCVFAASLHMTQLILHGLESW